jgi:hypothetical protein
MHSGRWLAGLSSRVKREAGVEACAEPDVVLRVRDGVTMKIELRNGTTVEDALAARDADLDAVLYDGGFAGVEVVEVEDV